MNTITIASLTQPESKKARKHQHQDKRRQDGNEWMTLIDRLIVRLVGWLVGWLVRVVCVGCMLYVVINKNSMQLSSSARMYMHREHDGGVRFRLLKRELLASGVWVNTRTCTYHNLFWVVVMVVSISCRDVCNSITNNINKFQFYGTCNGRIKTTCLLAMDIFRLPPSTTTM